MLLCGLKKYVSCILILTVIAATAFCVTAADDTADEQPEGFSANALEQKYLDAADMLVQLGILQGDSYGDLRLENEITRAEFSTLISKLLGMDTATTGIRTPFFSDVPETHWAVADIGVLTAMRIVNGYDDGNFYPDETITVEQAIKILVCALGYEYVADMHGGYPTGYFIAASDCGILRGVDYTSAEQLTRAKAALLIYNALFADIAEYRGSGTSDNYVITEGETLLTRKLNIHGYEGIITGTDATRLASSSRLPDNMVEINNVLYDAGTTQASQYLGYHVEFFVREGDTTGIQTIVAIRNKDTEVLEVKPKNVKSLSFTRLEYFDNDRLRNVGISSTADFIYNGVADLAFNPADIQVGSCHVELIDNNGDSRFDVVSVCEYVDFYVDRVDMENSKIFDKNDFTRVLDLNSQDVNFDIYENGTMLTLQDIKSNDVLSAAISKDKTYVKIEVSRSRIAGPLEGFSDGDCIIDGEEYEFSASYPDNKTINIGDVGTFYLNIDNQIVAFDWKADLYDEKYAYLIDYNAGSLDSYRFKLFSQDGEMLVLESAEEIKLNGEKNADIMNGLLRRDSAGNVEYDENNHARKDQLIKFRTNDAGEIVEITTALHGYHENEFSLAGTARVGEYAPNRGRIGGYGYTGDTLFMRVPSLDKEENFAMIDQSRIAQGSSFEIEAYDCNDVNFPQIIVIRTDAEGAAEDIDHLEPVSIVLSVTKCLVDGEEAYRLHALRDGVEIAVDSVADDVGAKAIDPKNVFFNTEKTIKDLKRGDVIQYGLDSEGRMDRFKYLFGPVPAPLKDVWENGNDDSGLRNHILFSTVDRRSGNYIVVKRAADGEIIFDVSAASNVYVYDQSREKFFVGNHADVAVGSTVLVHQNEWNIVDILVYPDGSLN